jgi:hypothetical protein
MSSEGAYEDFGHTSRIFLGEYLDFPVLITPRIEFLSKYTAIVSGSVDPTQKHVRSVMNVINQMGATPVLEPLDPDEYPAFFNYNWSSVQDNFTRADTLAREIYFCYLDGLAKKTAIGQLHDSVPLTTSSLEGRMYTRWSYWDDLIGLAASASSNGRNLMNNPVKVNIGKDLYVTNGKVIVCVEGPPLVKHKLFTWEQGLMIKDALYSRAQVMSALRVIYPGDKVLESAVLRLYRWHEICLTRHGNKGYEILKSSESLAKAYLSLTTDDVFGPEGPYERMVDKIRKKEFDYGTRKEYIVDSFLGVVGKLTTQQTVEIFGLLKVSGHPLVDPYLGGASAAAIAREPDKVRYTDAIRMKSMFKKKFTEAFIKREKMWPKIEFIDPDLNTRLQEYRAMNYLGGHRMKCPLSDWENVRFLRNFEFDFCPNFLEMIDDKAISQMRTNIASNWDKEVEPLTNRRLLIEMINREEIDIKRIVYMVMRREIPFDWLIVSLHPKEREFKLAPRMFSMMVMEMRIFFAVTEMNLADTIYPYMESLTMTDSREQVMKKFLDMTARSSDDTTQILFLEIDLSRWNLRWRKLVVHLIGDCLDALFGMHGVYTYVHDFFEKCLFVVRVAGLRPKGIELRHPPESELAWGGGSGAPHLGGCEGIVQKEWSIPTCLALDLALEGRNLHYKAAGQGDNQVVTVYYSRDRTTSARSQAIALRDELLVAISSEYAKVGQEVKPEECLESSTVITYSKDIFVKGVYCPTALKFHSRLFPHAAQDFPSIRSNVGAIFSGATAGGERCLKPIRSLYLGLLQAALYLANMERGTQTHSEWIKDTHGKLSDSFISFVLTLPSDLGGFPTAGIMDFLYKGGSDPLSKSLSNMVVLQASGRERLYDRMLAHLDDERLYSPDPKPLSLIRDPYSVPFEKPVTPIDGITKQTMEAISGDFKNKALRELVETSVTEHLDELVEVIGSMRPFNPLIAHDILDCSIYGVVDTIGKMFVATRTLQSVARDYDGGIIDRFISLERAGLNYLVRRYETLPGSHWNTRSVHTLASQLRHRWAVRGGPEPEGITTHHPIDCRLDVTAQSYLGNGIHACVYANKEGAHTTRGRFDPYVGSKTREKRSEHGYRIIGSDTTSAAFRKLQLISGQVGSHDAVRILIDIVGLTRSNTVLSQISELLPTVTGGTLSHRYAARAGHQEAYCTGSPNFYTHCMISADRSGKLSGGIYDYPIMFQEYFLMALSTLMNTDNSIMYVVYKTDELEMNALPNLDITVDSELPLTAPRLETNPLAFVDHVRLERVRGVTRHRVFSPRDWTHGPQLSHRETIAVTEARIRQALHDAGGDKRGLDLSTRLVTRLEFDLAEVTGVGVKLLVRAASNVIADVALSTYMRTTAAGRERWRIEAMCLKMSDVAASMFGHHLSHPLVAPDPFVRQLALYDGPGYWVSTHTRLSSVISQQASTFVLESKDSYCLRPIAVTVGDAPMQTFTCFATYLTRVLHWAHTRGHLSTREFLIAYKRFVLSVVRSARSESSKISMIVAATQTLGDWSKNSHLPELARNLNNIITGGVTHYAIAPEELMRLTRGTTDRTLIVKQSLLPKLSLLNVTIRKGDLPSGTIATCLELRIKTFRALGSRPKTALIWTGLSDLYRERPVLCVGVGQGSSASVAITNGAKYVYGVDLLGSTPVVPHSYVNYVPPLVREVNGDNKYLHLHDAVALSGDWFNPLVVNRVLRDVPEETCILIDIELGGIGKLWLQCEQLCDRRWQGPVIMRSYGTLDEWSQFYLKSRQEGLRPRLVSGGTQTLASKCVVAIFSNMCERRERCASPDLKVRLVPDFDEQQRPGPDAGSMARAALYCTHPSSEDTPLTVYTRLVMIYRRLVGEYESRPSHEWWTKLILAVATYYWVVEQDCSAQTLTMWDTEGEATVRSKNQRVTVSQLWNTAKTNHVSNWGARIANPSQTNL